MRYQIDRGNPNSNTTFPTQRASVLAAMARFRWGDCVTVTAARECEILAGVVPGTFDVVLVPRTPGTTPVRDGSVALGASSALAIAEEYVRG